VAALICLVAVFYIVHNSVDRLLVFPEVDYRLNVRKGRRVLREIGKLVNDDTWMARRPRAAQTQMRGMYRTLGLTLQAIEEDENKHDVLNAFLTNYLIDIQKLLRSYHRLTSRQIASGRQEVIRTELMLPTVQRRVHDLYEGIHERDGFELSATRDIIDETADPNDDRRLHARFFELGTQESSTHKEVH
jgi:hypothetical protein